MKQLLPYTPMRADVEAAIQKLQRAEAFDAEAFAVLNRERWKRGPAFIAIMIPLFGLFMGLIWVVDALLTTIAVPIVLHVFSAFLLAVLTHSALLRDTMKDHMRLGHAIGRWGGERRAHPGKAAGAQSMIRWGLSCGAALLIAAIVAIIGGWWTPLASRYIQGVDVSHHQGAIDWRTLAADDVAFAYIKATEGADHVDPRFAFNWREAGDAGLYRGGYHFFTLCQPGVRQAANFIAVVPRAQRALPAALDLEHMGPCRLGPTMPDVVAEARAFLDRVEAHYGVRPIIYTTREFHDAHLSALEGERFWIRSLGVEPRFRQRDWIIWQHHNRGHKRGVSGPIDLNAFRGDATALAAFASTRRSAS